MIVTPDSKVDEAFIKAVIAPKISDVLRDFDKPGQYGKEKVKRPEYYPGYNTVCDLYDQLKVHTDATTFPEALFKKRSPNMTADEFDYIKANFKAVTLPVWEDFVNSIGRCWNASGFDVKWPADQDPKYKDDNSTRTYTENDIPLFGSVESYLQDFYTSIKLQDANGAIAVIRKDLIHDPKNVTFNYLDSELAKPEPEYYTTYQVVDPLHQNYFIVQSNEKSTCKKGNNKQAGNIYLIYTKEDIFIMYQYGDYEKFKFEVALYYKHDLGYLPIRRNGGKPVMIKGHVHYLSPFQFAVPNLDLVLLNSSNLQLSINNVVYPVRVMVGNECDFESPELGRCVNGMLGRDDSPERVKCSACMGTGLKSRLTPLGTMLIKPGSKLEESEGIKPSEAIYYVSPDVTSLEFLEGKIDKDENRARGILHLKNNQNTAQGENPVESESNAQGLYAFIKPNSDQLFNIYKWLLETIGKMREGTAFKGVEVIAPIEFEVYSAQDYLNQIKDAVAAQQPPFVIYTIIDNFLNRMFYTNEESAKRYHLIMAADRLVTLSDNAISIGESKGVIAPWEILLHQSGINLVGELEREKEDEDFWELDFPEQITALQELAKTKVAEIDEVDPTAQMVAGKLNQFAPPVPAAPVNPNPEEETEEEQEPEEEQQPVDNG